MEGSYRLSRPGTPRRIAGRTIAVVVAVTTALGGCSFAMHGPDPSWNGEKKPHCAEGHEPVMLDALTSTVLASTAVETAIDDKVAMPAQVTVALIGVAVLYAVSAASGARAYRACRTATGIWRAREAIRDRNESAARRGAPLASPAPPGVATEPLRVATASPTYFCVHSPSHRVLEICLRERSQCEHARDLLGRRSDENCAPQDAVWCFDASGPELCFATRSACETELTRAHGAEECSERW